MMQSMLQLWRPLVGPVVESPLALIDVRTMEPGDMMEMRLDFEAEDPRAVTTGTTSYVHACRHNPGE